MRTPHRTALLQALAALWDRYPHWRFGQLVSNVAGWADTDPWEIEDEQLLAAANGHLDPLRPRGSKCGGTSVGPVVPAIDLAGRATARVEQDVSIDVDEIRQAAERLKP